MVKSVLPTITVVASLAPRSVLQTQLAWAPGLIASKAALSLIPSYPDDTPLYLSVWGKRVAPDALLYPGDRLELTRDLRVDPKTARRERFQKQGSRGAGLFKLRPKVVQGKPEQDVSTVC